MTGAGARTLRRLGGRALGSRLATGTLASFAIRACNALLAYAVQVALARSLGLFRYGVYAYAATWATILAGVVNLGLSVSAVRFLPVYAESGRWGHAAGLVRRSQQVAAVCGLGTGAALLLLARVTPGLRAVLPPAVALALLALIPLSALSLTIAEVLRALGYVVRAYAPGQLLAPLLLAGGVLVLARRPGGLDAPTAVYLTATTSGVAWLLGLGFARQQLHRHRAAKPRYAMRAWLDVGLPSLVISASAVLLGRLDALMVGTMLGARAVAVYNVASRVAAVTAFVLAASNTVLGPRIAALYAAGRRAELQRALTAASHMVVWPTLLCALALAALAHPLLGMFGEAYVGGRTVLLVLLLGQVVNAAAGPVMTMMQLTGHQREGARIIVTCALGNAALNLLFIRLMGTTGAALSSALTMAAWNIWLHAVAQRRTGIRPSILSSPWAAARGAAPGGGPGSEPRRRP